MVAVFDIKEQKGSCHEHAQDGDGGQDAVQWHVDVPTLQPHKRPIFGGFDTWEREENSLL